MVTMEWSDWRDGLFWWIQSVFVTKEFRRQGVYKAMYEKIQTMAESEPDVIGFRLYVEKDNRVARNVYETLGMQESDYRLYEVLVQSGEM